MENISTDELLFFERRQRALPLYLLLREKLSQSCPCAKVQVKKTQISLVNRRLFGAVSFAALPGGGKRSALGLTVTFGLEHPLYSPRIAARVEAYPNRWTHHVAVAEPAEIDDELLSWLKAAADFSAAK